MTHEFMTGRTYGVPQRLTVEVLTSTPDDFGSLDVTVQFTDHARHISGTVDLIFITSLTAHGEINDQLLRAYDAGQYK